MKYRSWFMAGLVLLLAGCTTRQVPELTPEIPLKPTSTPAQTATNTIVPTSQPSPTAITVTNGACSPLQGFTLDEMKFITSNPFKFKYPFSEGPDGDKNHPAIDLGFYSTKIIPTYAGPELNTDDGVPIQALLPGKVVESVEDLYPYGNMIMIETPLSLLSADLISKLKLPEPYSQAEISQRSPCQKDMKPISWSQDSRSIYVLYAHMKTPSPFQKGDNVACGAVIGAIGATGNSSESIEHLHLEARVGPADAGFGVISTYTSSATAEERYNYCIWALSEVFRPIDPAVFWSAANGQ